MLLIGLFLLIGVTAYASDGIPPWMVAQDKSPVKEECVPSLWVITNPQTGERNGIVLETIFNPTTKEGAGTCMFRVAFPDIPDQWMVTFSQSERLARQKR